MPACAATPSSCPAAWGATSGPTAGWSTASPATGALPLLVDSNGELLEAARANVWLIEDGHLVTPPADGRILPGVTRAMLLGLHRDAREEPITVARAKAADTMFLTSALRHAVAAGIDGPGRTPPELATIREALSTSAWS